MTMRTIRRLWAATLFSLIALTGCGERDNNSAAAQPLQAEKSASVPKNDASLEARNGESGAFGEGVLAYPDDLQMTMLVYALTDRAPPLEAWAAESQDVRRANEFEKADRLREETARLAAVYETVKTAGFLQLRLRSQLSQYDGVKGGYYLTAFSPGRQTTFDGREPVNLQLTNMSDAFFWSVKVPRAQDILEQTGRNVSIDVTVRLTGSERRSSGLVVKGRIETYGIYSQRYNDERLLAQFSLE